MNDNPQRGSSSPPPFSTLLLPPRSATKAGNDDAERWQCGEAEHCSGVHCSRQRRYCSTPCYSNQGLEEKGTSPLGPPRPRPEAQVPEKKAKNSLFNLLLSVGYFLCQNNFEVLHSTPLNRIRPRIYTPIYTKENCDLKINNEEHTPEVNKSGYYSRMRDSSSQVAFLSA